MSDVDLGFLCCSFVLSHHTNSVLCPMPNNNQLVVRGSKPKVPKPGRRGRRQKRKTRARSPQLRRMRAQASVPVDVASFKRALMNPFSPAAVGARVPDAFPLPTATYHVRSFLSATTGSFGTFKTIITPSPCFTYITRPNAWGSISGGTNFTQNATASGTAGFLMTPSAVALVLTEYRVVSWGLRLIAKNTAFAAKGKVAVAVVPTTANAPSWNTMETVTASSADVISEYVCGMEFGPLTAASIMGVPGVQVFSAQDLLRGEVQVCGLPTGAEFYQFRGTTDRSVQEWNTNQVLADEGVFNNTTGLVNATAGGRKDVASLRGGVAVVIFASGMNATTNEFDIELVYHLEGLPNVGATGSALLVPSAAKSLTGDLSMVEKTLGIVRKAVPVIRQIASAAFGAARAIEFGRGVPMIVD